jgi:hypothetical protein
LDHLMASKPSALAAVDARELAHELLEKIQAKVQGSENMLQEVGDKLALSNSQKQRSNTEKEELRTKAKAKLNELCVILTQFDDKRVEHRCCTLRSETLAEDKARTEEDLLLARHAAVSAKTLCEALIQEADKCETELNECFSDAASAATKHTWASVRAAALNQSLSAEWLRRAIQDKVVQLQGLQSKKELEDAEKESLRRLHDSGDANMEMLDELQSQLDKCQACDQDIEEGHAQHEEMTNALTIVEHKLQDLQDLQRYGQQLQMDELTAEAEREAKHSFGEFPTLFKVGSRSAAAALATATAAASCTAIQLEVVTPEMLELRKAYAEQQQEMERLRADMIVLQQQQDLRQQQQGRGLPAAAASYYSSCDNLNKNDAQGSAEQSVSEAASDCSCEYINMDDVKDE